MTTAADWRLKAEHELLGLQARGGGWPYRAGGDAAAEASSLAALAILARGPECTELGRRAAVAAAERVAESQQPDGSVGVSRALPKPGWATPYALLVWNALGGFEDRAERAIDWLLSMKGNVPFPRNDSEKTNGHDVTLVGWPWVDGTHSWLEPTALAVLALRCWGRGAGPRAVEGVALIRDRAIEGGGWNYGNKSVFGKPLRPQPGPTGLALLTLAGTGPKTKIIDDGIVYIKKSLEDLKASSSLAWGLLGASAWSETPESAEHRLLASFEAASGRPDAPVKLAMLLLAAGARSLELLSASRNEMIS